MFGNTKYDFDDLYSECLIVTMRIVQHHSDLKVESREFKNLLFRSVKNRLIDLYRRFSATQKRDRLLEVSYEANWDDDRLAEVFRSPSYSVNPDELISTIQLVRKLEEKLLDEIDRKMLRQLLEPDADLLNLYREHEQKVAGHKAGRRTSGSRTEIPVNILGRAIGLNYRGAVRSLTRIRLALAHILNET